MSNTVKKYVIQDSQSKLFICETDNERYPFTQHITKAALFDTREEAEKLLVGAPGEEVVLEVEVLETPLGKTILTSSKD